MRYAITYQVGGEQHVQEVDAPDAATAADMIHEAHGRTAEMFELISVALLEDPTEDVNDEHFRAAQRGVAL